MKKTLHKLRFAVLATDIVTFGIRNNTLHVLLIKVNTPPYFVNKLGVPGGLIRPKENADESAKRHLKSKGGIEDGYSEQLFTFSRVDRDPRGRVVSVAYLSLLRPEEMNKIDTQYAKWYPVDKIPRLAYDHNEIITVALERLRARIGYTNIIQYLISSTFTLSELQNAYEVITGNKLDKRNFRKRIRDLGLVKKTGKREQGKAYRPALLYTFTKKGVYAIGVL